MTRARLAICLALAAMAVPLAASAGRGPTTPPKLELHKGDRIILIGNTLAERMQYFGNFETLLQSRFPDLDLVFHDLGWSADELTLRPRSAGFKDHGHTLEDEKPDVLIAAFGFNESFAGPKGLDKFKKDLDKFLDESTTTKYNGKAAPRLVLLSPIAHEDLHDPHVTDGKANNENIALYTEAMAEAAGKHKVVFVDLFAPTTDAARGQARGPAAADDQRHPPDRARATRRSPRSSTRPSSAPGRRRSRPTWPSSRRRSSRRTSSSSTTTGPSTAATSTAAGRPRSGSSTSRPSSPSSAR